MPLVEVGTEPNPPVLDWALTQIPASGVVPSDVTVPVIEYVATSMGVN